MAHENEMNLRLTFNCVQELEEKLRQLTSTHQQDSDKAQKEVSAFDLQHICIPLYVCALRYDTIRDTILTCARKPT